MVEAVGLATGQRDRDREAQSSAQGPKLNLEAGEHGFQATFVL